MFAELDTPMTMLPCSNDDSDQGINCAEDATEEESAERPRYMYVALTYSDLLRLPPPRRSIVTLLAMPEAANIPFDPPRVD